jgi:D-amino-acid dehydrogenase
MPRSFDVAVIGGGVIGLSIARSTAARGAQVVVLEADRIGRSASYGNAGLIVPSFSLPLANPQSIRGLPDLLWGKDRSLKLKLRLDPAFLRWTLQFLAACRQERMLATARAISMLAKHSLDLMAQWDTTGGQFGFQQKGWLHLYQTAAGLEAGRAEAEMLRGIGMTVDELTAAEALEFEPGLVESPFGALYYPGEAQVDPVAFCHWLAERAIEENVQIIESTHVERLIAEETRVVGVQLADDQLHVGKVVVAAGAWSGQLTQPLLGWLPLEPAKGYSLTFVDAARKPDRPLMWVEKHVVMTPFDDRLRVTTGLDLVGFDDGMDKAMEVKLQETAADWVGEVSAESDPQAWFGYRPLTPDGRPILGPTERYPNLFLATGHGQLGVTLAPATGELLAAQLTGEAAPVDTQPFSPARFCL